MRGSMRRCAKCARGLGRSHALHIGGTDVDTGDDARQAQPDRPRLAARLVRAGRRSRTSIARWAPRRRVSDVARDSAAERMRLLRKVAQLIEERVYHIAAALTLEVGKNRMEALGEVQETADFFNVYCDDFERSRDSITCCRTIRCRTRSRAIAA